MCAQAVSPHTRGDTSSSTRPSQSSSVPLQVSAPTGRQGLASTATSSAPIPVREPQATPQANTHRNKTAAAECTLMARRRTMRWSHLWATPVRRVPRVLGFLPKKPNCRRARRWETTCVPPCPPSAATRRSEVFLSKGKPLAGGGSAGFLAEARGPAEENMGQIRGVLPGETSHQLVPPRGAEGRAAA